MTAESSTLGSFAASGVSHVAPAHGGMNTNNWRKLNLADRHFVMSDKQKHTMQSTNGRQWLSKPGMQPATCTQSHRPLHREMCRHPGHGTR